MNEHARISVQRHVDGHQIPFTSEEAFLGIVGMSIEWTYLYLRVKSWQCHPCFSRRHDAHHALMEFNTNEHVFTSNVTHTDGKYGAK